MQWRRIVRQTWTVGVVLVTLVLDGSQAAGQSRVLLKGGTVIDGSGQPAVVADVALRGDRIVAIGSIDAADQDEVIDVSGKVVAPGFIDLHNHSQRGVLKEPQLASQVSQGITTLIIGPDGSSPFPVGRYLNQVETQGTAVNVGGDGWPRDAASAGAGQRLPACRRRVGDRDDGDVGRRRHGPGSPRSIVGSGVRSRLL